MNMIYIYILSPVLELSMQARAKPAVQRRSRDTRDRIIRALGELLVEHKFDSISISDIAMRAKVSPASIYQRFENKDAATSILIELYILRVSEWYHASRGPDLTRASCLREAFIEIAMSAWQQFDELQHIMRPAYLYSRLRPDLLGQHWRAREEEVLHGFERLLEQYSDEIQRKDLSRAASMVAYFFNMMFLGRLLHTDAASSWNVPTNPEEFAQELADFLMGFLTTPD